MEGGGPGVLILGHFYYDFLERDTKTMGELEDLRFCFFGGKGGEMGGEGRAALSFVKISIEILTLQNSMLF